MPASSERPGRSWGGREGWREGGTQLLQLQNNSGFQLNGGKLALNKSTLEMRRMHIRSEAIGKSPDGGRKKILPKKTPPTFSMEISK